MNARRIVMVAAASLVAVFVGAMVLEAWRPSISEWDELADLRVSTVERVAS